MARFDRFENGRLIAAARVHAGFSTPGRLAEDMRRRGDEVTAEQIEAWECGKCSPDLDHLYALLEALEPPGGYAYFRPALHPTFAAKMDALTLIGIRRA